MMEDPKQAEQVALLARLAGRPPIETHISRVFAGAGTVWKLKKAVRLAFLDFSTPARRRHFLERELALNKPSAPDLYRDVMAIDRAADGTLSLVPAAESRNPVDWVLRMAPVDPADFLDAVAAQGGLDPGLLDALGDCVVHDQSGRPVVAGWNSAGALEAVARECVVSARAAGLETGLVGAWDSAITTALMAQADALGRRAASGHVRRCHGDLHLGNLCLWRGVPTPFDALEFDEAYATIDDGYDTAFLIMDLDGRAGRAAANRVFNRILARTGDVDVTALMPLFLSLRAVVRAHVEAASGHAEAGARTLDRAMAYLLPAPPALVAIGGLPGSGKSTLARRLAPQLGAAPGAVVLRSDEIRKRLFHVPPEHRLGQEAYTPEWHRRVGETLREMAATVLTAGHAAIADATFMEPAERHGIEAVADTHGVRFAGLWLDAPQTVLEARVRDRANDASDADVAVLRRAFARNIGVVNWRRVDADAVDKIEGVLF
jgi:aminoglycoside phosphotransferase family enzyme/predicted kinase